jgi:hypothetical protein
MEVRMTLDEAKRLFTLRLAQLRDMKPSPWPFLCAAAMLEYLAKMAIGKGRGPYKDFVRNYMRKEYREFQFVNGDTDLPEQIYHVLRCGIVHSFSLTPDLKDYPKGRNKSIVIAHEGNHLSRFTGWGGHFEDAVLLVFEDFANDIGAALDKVFSDAASDAVLKGRIEDHLSGHPPVTELLTTSSPHASGSPHP